MRVGCCPLCVRRCPLRVGCCWVSGGPCNEIVLGVAASCDDCVQGFLFGKHDHYFKLHRPVVTALIQAGWELHTTSLYWKHTAGVAVRSAMQPRQFAAMFDSMAFLLGFGDPLLAPSPLEALARGTAFINPIRVNETDATEIQRPRGPRCGLPCCSPRPLPRRCCVVPCGNCGLSSANRRRLSANSRRLSVNRRRLNESCHQKPQAVLCGKKKKYPVPKRTALGTGNAAGMGSAGHEDQTRRLALCGCECTGGRHFFFCFEDSPARALLDS